MDTNFKKRTDEIIEDFNKVIIPSQESAKFAEKLFMLIGELQGTILALELKISRLEHGHKL